MGLGAPACSAHFSWPQGAPHTRLAGTSPPTSPPLITLACTCQGGRPARELTRGLREGEPHMFSRANIAWHTAAAGVPSDGDRNYNHVFCTTSLPCCLAPPVALAQHMGRTVAQRRQHMLATPTS